MKTWNDAETFVNDIDNDFFWAYMDMREGQYLCPINVRDLLFTYCGSPM